MHNEFAIPSTKRGSVTAKQDYLQGETDYVSYDYVNLCWISFRRRVRAWFSALPEVSSAHQEPVVLVKKPWRTSSILYSPPSPEYS
jgi:hypothetical protein